MNTQSNMDPAALNFLCDEFIKHNTMDLSRVDKYNVKRGLRNSDGSGVLAGLTNICNVHGYVLYEGEKTPDDGRLTYRGIDVYDIIGACDRENRVGYEETVWLLLFGTLPTKEQLSKFRNIISESRQLPEYFAEDMIVKAPSPNIMNKLARSVLAMYSYDENPDDTSIANVLRQSILLISQMPTLITYAYQVKRRRYDNESMFFHPVLAEHSTAETILSSMRPDMSFTHEEAMLLDTCLIVHAEHGGGNNSTFTSRVLSSSGTDTYAAISAAVGSLKGPRHGGANIKTMYMLDCIKENVRDYDDDDEIVAFLEKLLDKSEGDHSGLIYGMGHAVYTKSDPRAVLLKQKAESLAYKKGFGDDFKLLSAVERLTPSVFARVKHNDKAMCANVDLYSGLVYRTLGISPDLFTPIFATARIAGWCAHRLEEIMFGGKIIRPAYKALSTRKEYINIEDR